MKKVTLCSLFVLLSFWVVLPGCKIVTQESDPPLFRPADHLIINEVSTLPLDHQSYYCWIEFLNPTADVIDATGWTLSMRTRQYTRKIDSVIIRIDSLGEFSIISFPQIIDTLDGIDVFDVPFGEGLFSQPGIPAPRALIQPGELLTITSNENRMESHTLWGPASQGSQRERTTFQGPIYRIDSLFARRDTARHIDTLGFRVFAKTYSFLIQPNEQLVLKDPAGRVMDVVRIGNYVP